MYFSDCKKKGRVGQIQLISDVLKVIKCIAGTNSSTSTSSLFRKNCFVFHREEQEQTYASISGIRQTHTRTHLSWLLETPSPLSLSLSHFNMLTGKKPDNRMCSITGLTSDHSLCINLIRSNHLMSTANRGELISMSTSPPLSHTNTHTRSVQTHTHTHTHTHTRYF